MWALIDHHLDVDSPLHRWHSTTKLVGMGAIIAATACVTELRPASLALLVSLAAIALASLPVAEVARRMRGLLAFVAAFALLLVLTADDEQTWSLGPLEVSGHALELAALVGCKAVGVALLAVAMVATTPFAGFCHSLRRLGCPARLVQVILLAYRMNFALGGENALAARGFRWRPGRRGLAIVGLVIGSLLVRSLDRADRLYSAMLARGYDGRIRCLAGRPVTGKDAVKTGIAILAAGALIGVQLWK